METRAKARKFILNYGLLLGVLMVVLGVVMYVMNAHLDPHWAFIVISFALFIAVTVYGIKAYKGENGGFLSIGEAIKVGVGIGLIAAILSGAWTVVLSMVIEPDYMEQVAALQREKMVAQFPDMSDAQMDQALQTGATFNSPWIIFASTLVMNMIFGLLVGLIAGAIMKEKRPYDI